MRSVQLAKVAAQAEGIRLQRLARRTGVRAGLGVVALIFFIIALVMAHIAASRALVPYVGVAYAPLVVAGIDLLVTIILGAIAATSKPGKIEREAYEVRETARVQAVQALAFTSLAGELFRNVGARKLVELAVTLAATRKRVRG